MEIQIISTVLLLSSLLPLAYLGVASGKIKRISQVPTGFQLYVVLRFRWHILGVSFLLWLAGIAVSHLNPASVRWFDNLSGIFLVGLAGTAVYLTTCNRFPAVREAQFLAPEAIKTQLSPDDPVIGLEINGEARAYPIKWLKKPLIVEDTVGNIPVVITFCAPCKQVIVFSTDFEFGSLRLILPPMQEHNVMLYDERRKRLIQQNSGQIIFGPGKGKKLPIIPVRIVPWVTWETNHPESKVFYHEENEFVAQQAHEPVAFLKAISTTI